MTIATMMMQLLPILWNTVSYNMCAISESSNNCCVYKVVDLWVAPLILRVSVTEFVKTYHLHTK